MCVMLMNLDKEKTYKNVVGMVFVGNILMRGCVFLLSSDNCCIKAMLSWCRFVRIFHKFWIQMCLGYLIDPLRSSFLDYIRLDGCFLRALRSFWRFFLFMIPTKLFLLTWFCHEQFFQSPHTSLKKLALGSVNQYIMLMPAVSILCYIHLVSQ